MDQAAKEYADAMEKGWELCPKMARIGFFEGGATAPTACCGNGHAALGSHGRANAWVFFEKTIEHIKVQKDHATFDLPSAIDILAANGWTTPEIVAWIRECNV